MREYHTDSEALEIICGNCEGAGVITEADVLAMAAMHADNGMPCPDDMIQAALRSAGVSRT